MQVEDQKYTPITDTNVFVKNLIDYHNHQVAKTKHMMDIPEGTEVEIDENEVITLEGDTLKAFQLGIQVALYDLGTLPIKVEYGDE